MSDLISRADAIEAVAEEWLSEASAESPYVNDDDMGKYRKLAEELFEDVPSAEQVTGKLKKHCDSLLKDDSDERKEQESKLDLISRADAIGTVRNSEVLLSYDSEWSCDVLAESAIEQTRDCLTNALKALPSASVEVGEWVLKTDDFSYWYVCSQCGERPMCNRFSYREERSDYCPNCGARMIGGGDDGNGEEG